MKKVLSMILILALVLSCAICSVSVTAASEETISRYIVLILDGSSSMSGRPIEAQTKAAINFCDSVLQTEGNNHIAIVRIADTSAKECDFTDNSDTLYSAINRVKAVSNTNINQALTISQSLLNSVQSNSNIRKSIVLCSDGLPQTGARSSSGLYTSADNSSYYSYANAAHNTAISIRNSGVSLYTLGFFHSLNGLTLDFGRKFMKNLQNAGYYEVNNPDDLVVILDDLADDVTTIPESIDFYYGTNCPAKCYYSDDYFGHSSFVYNSHLATMSMSLSLAAFGSGEGGEDNYENKSSNAKDLLQKIGIASNHIEINRWFSKKPTTDSMAAIAGYKKIIVKNEEYTLVTVALRGGGYEQEWASNFTLGESGQHNGFETARNEVLTFLERFFSNQGINGKVKLWLTGYSRAAAVSNLVSAYLHDSPSSLGVGYSLSSSDIYTYGFETPAGTIKTIVTNPAKYNNIFNIINPNDPVPKVAPSALEFRRYGLDIYLPSREAFPDDYDSLQSNMLKEYDNLKDTSPYVVDNFTMKALNGIKLNNGISLNIVDNTNNHLSQCVFLNSLISSISRLQIQNRSNYVAKYQNEIRELCSVVFGCKDSQRDIFLDTLKNQAQNEYAALLIELGVTTYISLNNPVYAMLTNKIDKVFQRVSKWLKTAIQSAGITDYDEATINSAGKNLGKLIVMIALTNQSYSATAVMNADTIAQAHEPTLCFAWLMSMDSYYNPGAKPIISYGSYRIVRINCDVNVKVTDSSGKVVASITNDIPDSLADNNYIYGVDESGQKYVILPVDKNYNISITGREDDTVNYGIKEYDASVADYTRNINYFDVALAKNKTLTGTIPAFTNTDIEDTSDNGSSVTYTLKNPDGQTIAPAADDSGETVSVKTYTVSVESNNSDYGIVTGSGVFNYGEFAQVEASAANGYEFTGWYENNTLVSTDAVYRFRVEKDVELVGKFAVSSHVHTFVEGICSGCGEGITLNKTSLSLLKGKTYTLKATVNYTSDSKTVTWSTSSSAVATVSSKGVVTAKSPGTATITAKTPNGNKVTCKVTVSLPAPKLVSVANTASGVQFKLNKSAGAAKYRIFRKTGFGSWKKLADTTALTYIDKSAKSGTKYAYTVRCISKNGKTYTSSYDTTGKIITYIAAPNIMKLENTNTGVRVTWKKSAGAAKYRVFIKNGKSWKKLADTTALSYTHKAVKSGKQYSYTVRCISKNGKSFTSGYNTTGKTITYIAAPKISSLSNTSTGIRIAWMKSAGAAKYRVMRKTGSGAWKKLADTTSLTYTDTTAKPGVSYRYTVRCITKNGKAFTSSFDAKGPAIIRQDPPQREDPLPPRR